MPVNLSVAARNGSTYVVTSRFSDMDGSVAVPKSVKWTLMDEAGAIINGRDQVEADPAAIAVIVLSGPDLLFADGAQRVVLIEAVYDSTVYGNDLPLNEEVRFPIVDLVKVNRA